ncbi:MAG: acetyl-CoA carboxylase carboxyltransferase subunit alpha [Elusimicrobiota bacterium]
MNHYLDFEKPIFDLSNKISELKNSDQKENLHISRELKQLEDKCITLTKEIFSNLTPWQKVQLARHPQRPYTLDYIKNIADNFIELHGDRLFAEDKAIVGGIAEIEGKPIMIIGQQKGRNTDENIARNFGMPHPEGYRKALRLMKMAERFQMPIVTFIDTPGAYPGIGAEERGQAEAIARNLKEMAMITVPIIVIIIGEGGSGGALAIGVGDRICMMQYTIYSVISPEGCSSILWRDAAKASIAAEALKLTPEDLFSLNIIDEIIDEPLGGAHRDYILAADNAKRAILKHLAVLSKIQPNTLIEERYKKFKKMGKYSI